MVLKLFTTFTVVAAILASPKHRDFTWTYRSSIYRVHCSKDVLQVDFQNLLSTGLLQVVSTSFDKSANDKLEQA